MARIKGELNAFDSERAAEGQSKTTKLATEVKKALPAVKESAEVVNNQNDKKAESQQEAEVPEDEVILAEKQEQKEEPKDNRFSLDKFAALSKGLS